MLQPFFLCEPPEQVPREETDKQMEDGFGSQNKFDVDMPGALATLP